jgi:hypothetical protein
MRIVCDKHMWRCWRRSRKHTPTGWWAVMCNHTCCGGSDERPHCRMDDSVELPTLLYKHTGGDSSTRTEWALLIPHTDSQVCSYRGHQWQDESQGCGQDWFWQCGLCHGAVDEAPYLWANQHVIKSKHHYLVSAPRPAIYIIFKIFNDCSQFMQSHLKWGSHESSLSRRPRNWQLEQTAERYC